LSEKFEIVGPIRAVQVIASNTSIRSKGVLNERFGRGRWRKMKGVATVRFINGRIATADLHWYEAHGVGRRGWKVKRELK